MSIDTLPTSRPRLRYGLSYLAAALVGILACAVLLFLVAEKQSVYHGWGDWGDWGVTMVTAIFGLYVVPAMFAASLLAPALAGLLHQRASWVGYGLLFGAIYVVAALVVCAGVSMTYAPRFLPAAAVVGVLGGLIIGKFLLRRGSTEPVIDVPNEPRS